VHAHIGDTVEPDLSLVIEIRIVKERSAVDDIAAQMADGTLDFALRLRAIRTTGAGREAPVTGEAQKLRIAHERAAFEPQVARDDRLHLIEEQLLRDATEIAERLLETVHERRHILARIEAAPQQPRVAEDHEQGVAHAPVKSKSCEVDLRLSTSRRLEPDDWLRCGSGRTRRT
jgi:hypothetical protein